MNAAEFMIGVLIFFALILLGVDVSHYNKMQMTAKSIANDARDMMTNTGSYNEYVEAYIATRLRQDNQNPENWKIYVDDGNYDENSLMEIRLTSVMQPTFFKMLYKESRIWTVKAVATGFTQVYAR
ncbi:hypothetical protein ABHN11_24505 [Brevibacillus centrosporus]|uniref:hypothetical protein n=1 Tax=Brevibacillus centrosporus TaxID=54910 RepID=UPI003D1B9F7F